MFLSSSLLGGMFSKVEYLLFEIGVPFLRGLQYPGARRGEWVLIIQSLLQMTKSLSSNLEGTFEHLNTISDHKFWSMPRLDTFLCASNEFAY